MCTYRFEEYNVVFVVRSFCCWYQKGTNTLHVGERNFSMKSVGDRCEDRRDVLVRNLASRGRGWTQVQVFFFHIRAHASVDTSTLVNLGMIIMADNKLSVRQVATSRIGSRNEGHDALKVNCHGHECTEAGCKFTVPGRKMNQS